MRESTRNGETDSSPRQPQFIMYSQLNIIVIEVDEELLKKNENPKLFWLAYLKKDIDDEPDVVHTVTKKELRPLMRKERDCLSARNVERPTSSTRISFAIWRQGDISFAQRS